MTGTEVATTGSFTGADVDGLDKLAHDFTAAAQVVDMVKTACEIIVAAASMFGPFATAFIAYLKGTVIPWLTKISEALKAMSKVLSIHSAAQKDASSSTTSLPSYTGVGALPTTSTTDAPQITAPVSGTTPTAGAATSPASTVTAPPTIGGSVPAGAGSTTGTAGATAGSTAGSVPPIVQTITAITGLVTAVDHLIHPGSSGTATTPTTPTTIDGSTPGTVGGDVPTTGGTTPVGGDVPSTGDGSTPAPVIGGGTGGVVAPGGGVLGAPGTLGGTGGIDLSTLHPLHPGDTVGVISVPVDIAPDGTVTPLVHTPLDPGATTSAPTTHLTPHEVSLSDTSGTPTHLAAGEGLGATAPATHAHLSGGASTGSGGGSLGSGGGSVSGGSLGGGSLGGDSVAPSVSSDAPTLDRPDATLAAHTTPAAEPGLRTETIGSHDGLFSGLGQATGIGAGAAALARAVLHEAKQSGDGTMAGATPSPFDADSDASARSEIFSGAIG